MTHKVKGSERRARGTPAPARPAPPTPGRFRLLELRPAWVALGLVALHLLLAAAVFDPTIFTGGDNGAYVSLARALLQRHSYISIYDPALAPQGYYPPGYPAILALASLVGVHPWVGIKILGVLFSAAGVTFSYLWLRRRSTAGVALFAGLVTAVSPGLLMNSHLELSDVPFWALCALCLWALDKLPPTAWRRLLVAAFAAAAAYLTRSAGLPLLVAALGWLALERRWRELALFAVIILPGAIWWYSWTHAAGTGQSYGNQFFYIDVYQPELGRVSLLGLFGRLPENLHRYAGTMVPLLLLGRADAPPLLAFGTGVLVLAIAGWALRLRKPGLGEIFFPLYAGMLFLCPPPWAGERYLLPIVPLSLAYIAETGRWLVARWRESAVVPVAVAAVAVMLLASMGPLGQRIADAGVCRGVYRLGSPYGCLPQEWQDYLSAADWARTALPADGVVISRKPALFYALSDRRGIDIPKTERAAEFFRRADSVRARYLVLDRTDALTQVYSVPVVLAYPASFCIVRADFSSGTAVLGIQLEAPRIEVRSSQAPELSPCPAAYLAAQLSR